MILEIILTWLSWRLKRQQTQSPASTDSLVSTTSTTLTWAALYMVRYPEVQAKVHEELDKEVGVDRAPKMEDRVRLPFTEAVIMEIQRHGNIVPLGLRHLIVK